MKVINLVPWAGLTFSLVPGDITDLPDETAKARIQAGLMREPTAEELAKAGFAPAEAPKKSSK